MIDNAAAWLRALAARGIETRLANGRIRHYPVTAYRELTDEEVNFLRRHRAEIRAALLAGPAVQVVAPTLEPAAPDGPPAANEGTICHFCMRPCVGKDHELYSLFHELDEAEIWRRRAAQREADTREWELRRRYGLLPPRWDR